MLAELSVCYNGVAVQQLAGRRDESLNDATVPQG